MAAVLAVAAILAVVVAFRVVRGGDATDTPAATAQPTQTAQETTAAPAPGVAITATVRSDELLEVAETVTWEQAGPPELFLELADPTALIGIDNSELANQSVANLKVTIDGKPVEAVPGAGSPLQWLVESPGGVAPSTMEVTYELSGAVARSVPSTAGRALALFAPLSRNVIGDLPVHVEVEGDGVLSIACPGAPEAVDQACGRQTGDTWTAAPIPGDLHVVMVQLNLPPLA